MAVSTADVAVRVRARIAGIAGNSNVDSGTSLQNFADTALERVNAYTGNSIGSASMTLMQAAVVEEFAVGMAFAKVATEGVVGGFSLGDLSVEKRGNPQFEAAAQCEERGKTMLSFLGRHVTYSRTY